MNVKRYTLILHVSNQPGVLVRVAQIFARRGYNIHKLEVHPDPEQNTSVMTIVAEGVSRIEQIEAQLNNLIDVINARIEI